MLREGSINDKEIEVEVGESGGGGLPTFDIPGMPGAQMGMLNLGDIFGKAFGGRTAKRKMTVEQSHDVLVAEESDKLLDQEKVVRDRHRFGRAERHRVPGRDRQDHLAFGAHRRRRRCQSRRACSAICCR